MRVKNLIKLSFLLIVLFSFSQCKKSNNHILYNKKYMDEIKAARKDIVFYMSHNFIPGGTFAIAKEGEIIYSEGMGTASKDLEVPVTRNTKFRVGQVSELFTLLIYHRLIREGLLHPDSTIQHYYPDFPEKRYKLPIRHLAQQTSGLRLPGSNEKDWRGLNISLQRGIGNFKNDSLAAPPGWYEAPGKFNYNLLGAIMEKVTEKKYSDLLESYVTDTLNLENTLVDHPFSTIKGRSEFYDYNYISQVVNATFRDMRYRAPSEGLLSNAEDMVKFGNALLYSDYFKEIITDDYFEPVLLLNDMPSQMANGWFLLRDNEGRTVYGKSGSVTGGSASLLVYPAEKLVVACAVNLTSGSDDYPVFKMANHILPQKEEKEAKSTKSSKKKN